jgi:hypothetical protein
MDFSPIQKTPASREPKKPANSVLLDGLIFASRKQLFSVWYHGVTMLSNGGRHGETGCDLR